MSLFVALRLLITLQVVGLLLVVISHPCGAQQDLCSGSCGVHNISHPFRLTDSPDNCGDKDYTLSCENNQLMLYLGSAKYHVKSINHNNFTLRLVDANLHYSSLPPFSLGLNNFSQISTTFNAPYQMYQYSFTRILPLSKSLLYVSCMSRMDSSGLYVHDGATCMNAHKNNYSFYVNEHGSGSLSELGLGDACRIEFMYLTSWPAEMNSANISCTDVLSMLFYGFELSWIDDSLCKYPWTVELDANYTPHCVPSGSRHSLGWIIYHDFMYFSVYVVYAWCGVKLFLGVPCIIILLIYKWRRRHLSMYDIIEDFLCSDNNIMPLRYSYKGIKKITEQFKTKLGNGGYGSVFKGQLRSGRLVAVKLLDKSKSDGQDFINEVATIGSIHHVNVVQLIGFCVEGSKRALIYEFMQNGSLEKYIFSHHEESSSLSREKLYAISLGVARGIEYLHNGCNMKILHFDIKPHNILLDENFIPKFSDFGLARLCPIDNSIVSLTAARGTIDYMAPELFYRNVGTISYKADVYSYGMLLMEMAGRRKNLNALAEQSSQLYFPFWVYDQLHHGTNITIENDSDEDMKLAKKMMIVALWCIQTRPVDRPPMDKVLEMLEGDKELKMPNKPYLYPHDLASDNVSDHSFSNLSASSSTSMSDSKELT